MKKFLSLLLFIILLTACKTDLPLNTTENKAETTPPSVNGPTKEVIVAVNSDMDSADLLSKGIEVEEEVFIGESRFLKIRISEKSETGMLNQIKGVKNGFDMVIYTADLTPADDLYSSHQYAPQQTGLESVWENYKGNGIVVAVVDSGINNLHEDFGGSSAFTEGYNALNNSTLATNSNSDDNSHGTHVAGIIGARINSTGIAGAAPEVTLMPVKVLDQNGSGGDFDVAEGIAWAVNNGADVINLSLGGPSLSYITNEAVNHALENNVVVVVSSGNDSHRKINYPAALQGVICVGSSNGKEEVSDFSTGGTHVSVTAPGEAIISLSHDDNSGYLNMSGTSMSAPFVSGIAALLLQKHSSLSPAQVKSLLESTADDIGETGVDDFAGHGLVQADEALSASVPSLNPGKLTVSTKNKGDVLANNIVYLKNNAGAVLSAGASSPVGKVVFPDLPTETYYVESSYFGEIFTSDQIDITEGGSANIECNYDIDIVTFATAPSLYETDEVDMAMHILKDNNGTPEPEDVLVYMDNTATSLYPTVSFPVESGYDYYAYFFIPEGSHDTSGYFSMKYTLANSLDFNGSSTQDRLDLQDTYSAAKTDSKFRIGTEGYSRLQYSSPDGFIYLDFTL